MRERTKLMDIVGLRRRALYLVEQLTGFQIRRVRSTSEDKAPSAYARSGHIPFGTGYSTYKMHIIDEALSSRETMDSFRRNQPLPNGYGYAVDERCIEYPWVLSRIEQDVVTVLDAGSTLNHSMMIDHLKRRQWKVYVLTLAPEAVSFWRNGLSYVFDDLCRTPFRDDYFDYIICISTLEHVGFDNQMFVGDFETPPQAPLAYLDAVREMKRVLKPKGRLLLSVPFGRYLDMGTAQVFDSEHLNQVVKAFEGIEIERAFYQYSHQGWQISDEVSCHDARFVTWIAIPPEFRSRVFPLESDHAAAARAVALLMLEK